jgi:hypothetical protein
MQFTQLEQTTQPPLLAFPTELFGKAPGKTKSSTKQITSSPNSTLTNQAERDKYNKKRMSLVESVSLANKKKKKLLREISPFVLGSNPRSTTRTSPGRPCLG